MASEQIVAGEKVIVENLPKDDVQRRMSQIEAAVLTMADAVKKMAERPAPLTNEQKVALDKKADVALKDAAKRVDDFRKLKVGQICHTHVHETAEFELEDVPCVAVEYQIRNPQGIKLNGVLLTGSIIVPQCTANDFHSMDSSAAENEKALYSNKGRTRYLAEYRG